ncbi:hypothetical protein K504DRAFT_492078 [Pleomassaria siparia CBS 279.74]|uniref:Uncharacterized protein n=1 Tax=Pleomassaria siparia CBS 279.74 TaxID=1314801 RepID=A0A6G1K7K7_9PLEO|nr:hypothetical protein K504DRAFT_492078 [Pleomassaria siparia CBS 279.74]
MATYKWVKGPTRGEHDMDRLSNFVFPPLSNRQKSTGVGGLHGCRQSTTDMVPPKHLAISTSDHDISQLANTVSAGSLRAIDKENREGGLHRSVHNAHLRNQAGNSLNKGSTTASAGSKLGGIKLQSQEDEDGSVSYVMDTDPSKTAGIESWLQTATTMDNLLQSPLTPRPFTEQELRSRIYGEKSPDLYQQDNNSDSDNDKFGGQDWNCLSPVQDTDKNGPGYVGLAMMHRAQEQVRLGMDLPPLEFDGIQESDRARKLVMGFDGKHEPDRVKKLVLEPSPTGGEKGDPTKKPTHFNLASPSPAKKLDTAEDPQTYTTVGLIDTLSKIYPPGLVPPDVMAALSPADDLYPFSKPKSPTGQASPRCTALGSDLVDKLEQKDRDYIAYYIDTLLHRIVSIGNENGRLEKEVDGLGAEVSRLAEDNGRLEEDVEDAEVSKAILQGEVNRHMVEGRERSAKLGKLVEYIFIKMVPENRRAEVVAITRSMGIDLDETVLDSHEENGRAVQPRIGGPVKSMRVEEEVKYWKARAEAAERFVGAMPKNWCGHWDGV